MATHSLVTMPVVSHSQKRKKWLTIGMQVQRAMRLGAVQEDRDRRDRHMCVSERVSTTITPPRQVDKTVRCQGQPIVTH